MNGMARKKRKDMISRALGRDQGASLILTAEMTVHPNIE